MIPLSKVEELILKHASLEKELSSNTVEKNKFARKSKEYADLNEIIEIANLYKNFEKNKQDLENIINESKSEDEIKELAKTHKCELYINIDNPLAVHHFAHQAGNVFINKIIYEMLLPLFQSQKYIDKVNIYTNQPIDINFDLIRDLPINLLFDNLRYGSLIAGVQPDICLLYTSDAADE